MAKPASRVGALLGGKYRIVRLIGSGSMGDVYEGTHIQIGKRVAIKIMNEAAGSSHEAVARFYREARASAAVVSDFIVDVFDVGRDAEFGLFMISELLEGEDLDARLTREGQIDVRTAVQIGSHVSRGLAKAHMAGIVHRDLKPANIFLTIRDDDTLQAKILDFGISKLKEEDGGRDLAITGDGVALGTPQFMSPEQVQALPDIDKRTDLWSLAAVLYEALSGMPACGDQREVTDVFLAILRRDIPPLQKLAPWVPGPLCEVIHAGLERDRDKRIADAALFGKMLLRCLPEAAKKASGNYSVDRLRVAVPIPLPNRDYPSDDEIPITFSEPPPSGVAALDLNGPTIPAPPPTPDEDTAPEGFTIPRSEPPRHIDLSGKGPAPEMPAPRAAPRPNRK